MKETKSVLLIANGEAQSDLDQLVDQHDFLIAVDGGLRHLLSLDLLPDLLIGDLDSITKEELDACQQQQVEIHRFKPDKDESDLELALLEAIQRGFRKISIACASGGRIDHMLSSLALLFHPALQGLEVVFIAEFSRIRVVDGELTLPTAPGDLISLLPWGQPASGVSTVGLLYPLTGEALLPYKTRGLSNVALGNQIAVRLRQGQLLVIHTHKKAQ